MPFDVAFLFRVGIYVPALYGPFSFPGPQGYCRPLRGRYLTQALIWNIGRQAGYRQYPKKNILNNVLYKSAYKLHN